MEIKIEPVKQEFQNCFQAAFINIAAWAGRDYELMYMNNWDFVFRLKPFGAPNRLGGSLNPHVKLQGPLKLYHGIVYSARECASFENFIKSAEKGLAFAPAAAVLDTFYCPWDYGFRRYHNINHLVLITGLYGGGKTVSILDPFYKKTLKMQASKLRACYAGRCGFFEFQEARRGGVEAIRDFYGVLKSLFDRNVFYSIRSFACELDKLTSVKSEKQGFGKPWKAPLYWNVAELCNKRKSLPVLFEYMADRLGCKALEGQAEKFKEIIAQWELIKLSLLRLLQKESDKDKRAASRFIYEAADMEEQAAAGLLRLLNTNSFGF